MGIHPARRSTTSLYVLLTGPLVLSSGEKTTTLTHPVWHPSVCRAAPVPASQTHSVVPCNADSTVLPSGEKVTAMNDGVWPSSVCSNELHWRCTCASLMTRKGVLFSNCVRTKFRCGSKILRALVSLDKVRLNPQVLLRHNVLIVWIPNEQY